jgi:hypothetical protein
MKLGTLLAFSMMRFSIAVIWGLAPAVLVALAIRDWRRANRTEPRTRVMPIGVALAVLANWACFVLLLACGFVGGFGTHYVTTRVANWFVVGSFALLGAAVATKVARGKLTLASLLVLALWLGSEVVA